MLVPSAQQRKFYEALSTHYFAEVHSGYLLGQGSIPHISLCQFEYAVSEVEKIFKQWCCEFRQWHCHPEFSGLSIIKLEGQFSGLQAAELSVVRHTHMKTLHRNVVAFIRERGIQPLNAVEDLYRPHLTLVFLILLKHLKPTCHCVCPAAYLSTKNLTLPWALPIAIGNSIK